MTDLEILTVDNAQHSEVLRSKSRAVQKVTPKLAAFAEQMLETMRKADGVGLAAPQVGVLQRFFVAELPEDEENNHPRETYILFNPEIVKGKGEQVGYEGCLSIPGYIGEVARQEEITVKGLNERGKPVRLKVEGYLARVFQHEIDHLDGILFTDKLTDPDTLQPVTVGQEEAFELQAEAELRASAEMKTAIP
ncbi:MAG TPA: peptide deformylase [Anaerolineae bacterium]|nr:peptide deformylase [Anaerolineae bacterium]